MAKITRRQFLKGAAGGAGLALALTHLRPLARIAGHGDGLAETASAQISGTMPYRKWEDVYRLKWTWDKIAYGVHHVDCYPGNCQWRVYVKDGIVYREEQWARYPTIEQGVPDMNPRGCNKGICFSEVMYGAERLQYPLRRVGERGAGRWERISWDEALTECADAMLDAIEQVGPESICYEIGPGNGGMVNGTIPGWRFTRLIGGTVLDKNGMVSDFNVGLFETFGKFTFVSTVDDWFNADLILAWHMNPVYTRIPDAHFINEARYHGTTVISVAPDYNASSIHADLWVPVEPGTDAALALATCRILIDEGKINEAFVKEQTDLPLLVREDTRRYLRQTDVEGKGRDDQLYVWDVNSDGIAKAPLATLALDGIDPALRGRYQVALADGSTVSVRPAFEFLVDLLQRYDVESASRITKVPPAVIREFAARVGRAQRIHLLMGWNVNKYYHGDLIERAAALMMALGGHFGRKGTGMRGFNDSQLQVPTITNAKAGMEGFLQFAQRGLAVQKKYKDHDPTFTEEMTAIEVEAGESSKSEINLTPMSSLSVPAVFYWYWHCNYKDIWNRPEWNDPSMKRRFEAYLQEAIDSNWWEGVVAPAKDKPPQVLLEVGASTLRRTRGGYKMLLENLWPKLKKIIVCDIRMSSTARWADIVLPAAAWYEKVDFRFTTAHVNFLAFGDKASEPYADSKPEWDIFCLLARKIEERAKARGRRWAEDNKGRKHDLYAFYDTFTFQRAITEGQGEKLAENMVEDSVRVGTLPKRTTLDDFRREGSIRFIGLGIDAPGLALATDIKPDETLVPLRWHVERKVPYPSYARRIQFYIDHPWFLEAGEELPVHKDNPRVGGPYPLTMTSGHLRQSIHSTWVVNRVLSQTHRGQPTLYMNEHDMAVRKLKDGDLVRVFNDMDEFRVQVRPAAKARPGQVIIYHAWEPYQYRNWRPYDSLIPGMVKWLHLAGGYGHLKFSRDNWQPQQTDRGIAVEVEKA